MRVIVIGTGIVGASAAYYFAKNNVEIVMVDRIENGKATSAGAGIVCPWISRVDNKEWYEIAKRGALFYPELINQLKADGESQTGYKQVGALRVGKSNEELAQVEQRLKEKREEVAEVGEIHRLATAETKEMFPALADDLESVFVSGAARVDGNYLRESMKRAAMKHGATLIEGDASLFVEGTQMKGIHVNGETVLAEHVLIATGAWASELVKPLNLKVDIEPQRGQIAHISLPNQDTSNWPVVLPQTSHYMLAFDDSRVVAGATREDGTGFDYRLTAGGVQEVLEAAFGIAPGLRRGTLSEVRIGFRPMGNDILPIIGPIAHASGLYIANGLGASGLTMGPYVGTIIAKLMMNHSIDLNLQPYRPSRSISQLSIS